MTGAYKERGALNKILELTPEERERGLIAASAGNHAQAVSYHASKRGIAAQIVMPLATPLNKVMATRRFGGEVVLHGANYDEACDEAKRRAAESGLTFIHAFDDDAVIAGQGTLGLELLSQTPDVDVVITAIGGGGLISGMACALKEINPRIRVIGVQTSRLPSMKAAIDAGHLVTLPVASTLADGIAVRRAGERTLPMVQKYVDEIVTVEEEEIASAILLLLEREKTVAEGAGAAAVAAILHHKIDCTGKRIAAIVSGGNIDVGILSRIIERGLAKDGRLIRLRIHLPDYPGALHTLTGVLADHRANIVETSLRPQVRRRSRLLRHRSDDGNARQRARRESAHRACRRRLSVRAHPVTRKNGLAPQRWRVLYALAGTGTCVEHPARRCPYLHRNL